MNIDPSVRFGRILADPPEGEEIVVSGISGSFPLSENIEEFLQNLEDKVEMVTHVPPTHPELPSGFALMKDISRFDAGFFDVAPNHAVPLNPMCKMLLEKSYECIFDAGLHPSDLEGTRTGLFLGLCLSEFEAYYFTLEQLKGSNTILGNHRSLYANRVSHHLKLKGPSYIFDTACSSAAYAFEQAYKAIRMGQCDAVIVGGTNFVLPGGYSLLFAKLGMLALDGHCRPFDVDGTGYVRAETASAVLLQKAKDSKRIYAKLVHTKTNCDGNTDQGITYPSGEAQFKLLTEIYLESDVKPHEISYLEAHGTGTKVGDYEEVNSADQFFVPGRTGPLLVGSVKSNMGHSENASFLCSLVKMISGFETNVILPTINYKSPKPNLHAVIEGRIKVVTDKTLHRDDKFLAGISCFGFGGANCHAIMNQYSKKKSLNSALQGNLFRLVCVSGRTKEAVHVLLDDVAAKFDPEHMALVYNIFRKPIRNHTYRGYVIASPQGILKKEVVRLRKSKSQVFLYFGGVSGEIAQGLLEALLGLPLLTHFRSRITGFLHSKGIRIDGTTNGKSDSDLTTFLFDIVTQLTTVEFLKQIGIKPNVVAADSVGNFLKAFYEEALSCEEALESIYLLATKYKPDLNGLRVPDVKRATNGFNGINAASSPVICNGGLDLSKLKISKQALLLQLGGSSGTFEKKRVNWVNICDANNATDLLMLLGRLYLHGKQPQVQLLYPEVEFPVSRGTPMISSKIKWNHHKKYFIPTYDYNLRGNNIKKWQIKLEDSEWSSVEGHNIDGRILFPATNYLYLAWSLLSEMSAIDINGLNVVFENCRFLRACSLSKGNPTTLHVMLQRQSGRFEIIEGDTAIMTGIIKLYDSEQNLVEEDLLEVTSDVAVNSKDIYKELRLRGYYYNGVFKSLTESNLSGTRGKIRWQDDWVAFMDNMLQFKILGVDTRLLYVPTSIARLTINAVNHLEEISKLKTGEDVAVELPVRCDRSSGVIRSGGVKIEGLIASSIRRKKETAVPVLETYQFVPNNGALGVTQAVRVFMQVALENNSGNNIKVAELLDEPLEKEPTLLGPIIRDVLEDQPLVKVDVTILASQPIETDITVENKKLNSLQDCTVVIASNLLKRSLEFEEAIKATSEAGFIISREQDLVRHEALCYGHNTKVLNEYTVIGETLVFLKKELNSASKKTKTFVHVSQTDSSFQWMNELRGSMNDEKDVILWSQNEPINGLLGLVNCIRKEPNGQNVRCLLIADTNAPRFTPTDNFYTSHLDKGHAINIYSDGQWGSYRHLLLSGEKEVECEQCYADAVAPGDLSSVGWIEGPLTSSSQTTADEELVNVSYSCLNFRDVLIASGKINFDAVTKDRLKHQCIVGFEYVGRTKSGKRVMGMLASGALSSLVKADKKLMWEVPDSWSLEEAATTPIVYATCLYAFVKVGKIKPSHSVLIHSGTGGVGLAAINLCLKFGCTIFVTVGSEVKRNYLLENFPQLDEKHIGNSRNLSFEQMVMEQTNGRGVDLILNSLSEDKLRASVRCLSPNGKFLEIGKYDIVSDNRLDLLSLKNGQSFHGIMLDVIFEGDEEGKRPLRELLQRFINSGAVKPIKSNVFEKDDIQQAFRFMTTGKHMGKVLVKIGDNDVASRQQIPIFKGIAKFFADSSKSYIICGGLGGFGLELADWLIIRGARNLVLTSRKGISSGYQSYRISLWRSYGCNVVISTQDFTCEAGCIALIREANALAPVAGIFNLAVVLQDCTFPNQTADTFLTSLRPKAFATQYLDQISRKLCPNLTHFVVFSSVSCGRGNGGQTNYGMSNSIMERICEERRKSGYPGLAIQWGAVGDVGLVAQLQENNMNIEIGGTLPQSISSCLQVLDTFLRQNESAVVSSIVVAEKKLSSSSGDIAEVILGIIGIRDMKSVSMNSTLAEIGMDSMNGVEVKQTLERDYNIFLSAIELRAISLARILEMQGNEKCDTTSDIQYAVMWTASIREMLDSGKHESCIAKLNSKCSNSNDRTTLPKVFCFPGVEGVCQSFSKLAESLNVDVYGINYVSTYYDNTVDDMADKLLPHMLKVLGEKGSFHIVGHSLGTAVALELVKRLENLGYRGTVTFIDGSPAYIRESIRDSTGGDPENVLLAGSLMLQLNDSEAEKVMETIRQCANLDDKLRILTANLKLDELLTEQFVADSISATLRRIHASCNFSPNIEGLKTRASLLKPDYMMFDIGADYQLSQYFQAPVEVREFEGSHTSILQNKMLADVIMKNISEFVSSGC